jgi:hypothetical protein
MRIVSDKLFAYADGFEPELLGRSPYAIFSQMGLAISVGVFAYLLEHDEEGAKWMRKQLSALNQVLQAAGLPPHVEPEQLQVECLPHVESFPYSFIHHLRRAFSHTRVGRPALTPARPDFEPSTDEMLDEEHTLYMDSHLCCHSDAEGFYVPIDFADALHNAELPGGIAGSSYALLRELLQVAPLLGIPIEDGTISAATAHALADVADSDPYLREKIVWGALFATATASIEYRTVVSFG